MEWEDFLANRKSYLASAWALRKLPVTDQTQILEKGLKASRVGDVLGYLREVENPARRGLSRPVSEAMSKWLFDVATFPGEWSSDARDLVVALFTDNQGQDNLLQLVDRKIQNCRSNPEDEEPWLYLALLLREILPDKFENFLSECRNHDSDNIREVAAFFD